MMTLNHRTVLLGGFHDHWSRNGTANPSLLLAALSYYHYDFMCLMDGLMPAEERIRQACEAWNPDLRMYLGRERFFGWGHVVTVGSRAPEWPSDDTDVRRVLSRLTADCDFVALAHPAHVGTWEAVFENGLIETLLDEHCMHAVQYCGSSGERNWFEQRKARGQTTPIVAGWDAHLLRPIIDLPPVLYSRQRTPAGHIDTSGANRTIVLAEENSLAAIVDAVCTGWSLVEDLHTGEIVGNAEALDFLERHGYRDAIAQQDAERDATHLTLDRAPVAGEPLTLTVSCAGTLRIPGTLDAPEIRDTTPEGRIMLEAVPALQERDRFYFPVIGPTESGGHCAWAVDVEHPAQPDVRPAWCGENAGATVHFRRPFHGSVQLDCPGLGRSTFAVDGHSHTIEMNAPPPEQPVEGTLVAETTAGITRHETFLLTYCRAPRFNGDWSDIPCITIDSARNVPALGTHFGAHRPWGGPDVFSAQVQFAWTDTHLHMRTRVVDAVHYQPFRGHFVYNADCIQVGLDPLLRRTSTTGSIYVFNLSHTAQGPEVFRWLSPDQESCATFTPPDGNVSLGEGGLSTTPWARGMEYQLELAWHELAPFEPAEGRIIGLYMLLMNNDGNGLLDTLHWPRPIDIGMWLVPRLWGHLTLL